jgi:hypothetical protein
MSETQANERIEIGSNPQGEAPAKDAFARRFGVVVILLTALSAGIVTLSPTQVQVQAKTAMNGSGAANSRWTGYAATVGTFSHVSGSWIVPTASCTPGSTSSSSAWVGIDGQNGSTVEQIGTDSACVKGVPTYYAWYEMFGTDYESGKPVSTCVLTAPLPACITQAPASGDFVSAAVSVRGTTWTLRLTDATSGWTFSVKISNPLKAHTQVAPSKASAEWVVEQDGPSLTNFGSVPFTKAMATRNGHTGSASSFAPAKFAITNNHGSKLASVSNLATTGEHFTATWHKSA